MNTRRKEQPEKRIVLYGQAPGSAAGNRELGATGLESARRVFLLSPADAAGARAKQLLSATSESALVARLRSEGLSLGEAFTYMSSLYFRGKLTYARRFARPPAGVPGVLVITTSRGLLPPEQVVSAAELEAMTRGEVHHENEDYLGPLLRDAGLLLGRVDADTEVVLLGSIATPKYVKPLLEIFGERLMFPAEFVGIGDMSRGGLLLKSFREGVELKYVRIVGAKLSLAETKKGKRKEQRRRKTVSS